MFVDILLQHVFDVVAVVSDAPCLVVEDALAFFVDAKKRLKMNQIESISVN